MRPLRVYDDLPVGTATVGSWKDATRVRRRIHIFSLSPPFFQRERVGESYRRRLQECRTMTYPMAL